MEQSGHSNKTTLNELLLPGTPEHIAKAYATLATRAQTERFGLLEDDVVVLDTETTGLSYKNCNLIQVSAAKLRGNTIIDRFDSYVNPETPIPPEITKLTGIRAKDVVDAPLQEKVVAELASFVRGLPVLAHNATFDRTFIERVDGGKDVSDIWIDTLALSRIALPRLKSHKLSDMAAAFGCDAVTHKATDDVDALAGVWRVMLCALSDLPAGLLTVLSEMHKDIYWSYRPIFSQIAAAQTGAKFSLQSHRKDLIQQRWGEPRVDSDSLFKLKSPTKTEIEEEFTPEGSLGSMYTHVETRPEQLEMALEVREALATSTHRAIEAGTGVGKSLAYLIPAIRFAQANNVSVGVATKTNALTDQLVSKELPLLDLALSGGVKFTSLKGYEHYPCLNKLERATQQELPIDVVPHDGRSDNDIAQDMLTALATIYAFVSQSPEGDLDSLGIRWRYVPRDLVTTTSAECLKKKCPFYPNECLVHGARARAAESDIVVTNHALLLRNIAVEGSMLPPIRHWIVDEAHGFEAEARRQWKREVSGEEFKRSFERLGDARTGIIHNTMVAVKDMEGSSLYTRLLTKLASSSARAQVSCSEFVETLHGLQEIAFKNNSYDSANVWIGKELREKSQWADLLEAGAAVVEALNELSHMSDETVDALSGEAPQLAADIRRACVFAKESAKTIELISAGTDESYVYFANIMRSKRRMASESLCAEKLDIGKDLAQRWFPEMRSVTFTSATIAIADNFEHFEHAVGLDILEANSHKTRKLESSFDFDKNMAVVLSENLPVPSDPNYLQALEDLLFDVHVAMEGSVLTLFTNRREMEQVYKGLYTRLQERGLDLAMQEKSSSARRLRDRFIAEKNLSLLALKSFWEGFDAAGETLRCVVIPRLPFASPTDPLTQEREQREERAWFRFSLPGAVIEVKQAAGRLIRTANDAGVLVLADARLLKKSYGAAFIQSLPSKQLSRIDAAHIGSFIELWRRSRGC